MDDWKIYRLTKEQDNYIRTTYRGGMNNIYYIGEIGGYVYYLDFNSHFPR